MKRAAFAYSTVYVEGHIWQPGPPCHMNYTIKAEDVDKLRDENGQITGESVFKYMDNRLITGDFCGLTYIRASIEDGDETVEVEHGEPYDGGVPDDQDEPEDEDDDLDD